jgi:cyclopropane-fatty-acyl-phospholipid synthase
MPRLKEFDKISSIGMHEAIGIDNYPTYYSTIHRVLKPGGIYLHHAITRPAKKDAKNLPEEEQGIQAAHQVHLPRW